MKIPAATANNLKSRLPGQAEQSNRSALHAALLQNGRQLLHIGKVSQAISNFETILRESPDHLEANYVLAQIATMRGETRNAVTFLRKTLKLGSGKFPIHYAMAEVCLKDSLADEALLHINISLKIQPENTHAKVLKASILQQLGNLPEAFELARMVVAANPANDDAISVFATSAKFSGNEAEIDIIERAYAQNPKPPRLRSLGYSMGKIFNDAKEFDKAFSYFKASADTYEVKNIRDLIAERTLLLQAAYTGDLIVEKRKNGHQSSAPIFVVGMPRSGTTLTEQILASHPQIFGVGESSALSQTNNALSSGRKMNGQYVADLQKIDRTFQHLLAEKYLGSIKNLKPSARHYADKYPSNFFHIGLINILFPNAKIIHCVRDPLDTCVSCYTSPLDATHLYAKRLDTLAYYYRQYRSLMNYWKSVSQIPIFEMSYEATVADFESQARALIDYAGLPWNDACLKFNEAKTQVSTISTWQVRQPIYNTSVKRWKVYEKHLGPLIEGLGDLAVAE